MKKYLSLFSGIGCIEHILDKYNEFECIGFSEINKNAIKVYNTHFPSHKCLGSIQDITKESLDQLLIDKTKGTYIDELLIIGGFPCQNLSSLSRIRGNSKGLDGPKSGLFYELIRILELIKTRVKNIDIIIENNSSMSKQNKQNISNKLSTIFPDIFITEIDNASLAVQTRKRIFWTTFPIDTSLLTLKQTWQDVLDNNHTSYPDLVSKKYLECLNKVIPIKNPPKFIVKFNLDNYPAVSYDVLENTENIGKTRLQLGQISDNSKSKIEYSYPIGKSRPITGGIGGGISKGILVDRIGGWMCDHENKPENSFIVRYFSISEKEKLFGLPVGYTDNCKLSNTIRSNLIGNGISIFVIDFIIEQYLNYIYKH